MSLIVGSSQINPKKRALSPVLKRVKAVYYTAFGGTNAIPLPATNGTNILNNQHSQKNVLNKRIESHSVAPAAD
jgi:hypothetical protein